MNLFLQTLRNLGPARLAALGGIGVAVLGFMIYLMTRMAGSQTELLYGNLELGESKRIVSQLEQKKIPFELRKDGTEIFVPSDQVLKLRVEMAESGLAGGASVGYEIFDKQNALGATNFMQNLNMVRALEGELARTIGAINGVRGARVHLVLPHREMFSREEQKPSASVVLRLSGGRIGKQQVAAIQSLVSAAVPRMEPSMVAVVDDKGTLLARPYASQQDFLASTADETRRDYELRMTQAVEELLTRSLGPGKVRAEVSAELDFDRVVTNQEVYDPEGRVVRSTTTIEDKSQSQDSEPDSVSSGSNLPDAGLNSSSAKSSANSGRTEETVNYELTKKVINSVRETGVIKRLSVAVMVDGNYTGEGEARKYEPQPQAEMEKLTALVKSAVGYDANRGDQIEVVNMRFAITPEMIAPGEEILFMGFTKAEVMQVGQMLGVGIVAVLVILLIVRPLVTKAFEAMPTQAEAQRRLLEQQQMAQLSGPGLRALAPGSEPEDEFEGEDLIDIEKVDGRVRASSFKKIGEIVDKHPEEALSIVRNWLYQDGTPSS
ncbi:MAG: flagellar M-ring protein FliF [Alphaproteobacteria bacterium]|nr:flagellar M-ring protein FliF [Alphaproteobacteria bacterium]MBF0128580.1 flagellar M-ring protein FliF [Alphaproteobacteria bacterium]